MVPRLFCWSRRRRRRPRFFPDDVQSNIFVNIEHYDFVVTISRSQVGGGTRTSTLVMGCLNCFHRTNNFCCPAGSNAPELLEAKNNFREPYRIQYASDHTVYHNAANVQTFDDLKRMFDEFVLGNLTIASRVISKRITRKIHGEDWFASNPPPSAIVIEETIEEPPAEPQHPPAERLEAARAVLRQAGVLDIVERERERQLREAGALGGGRSDEEEEPSDDDDDEDDSDDDDDEEPPAEPQEPPAEPQEPPAEPQQPPTEWMAIEVSVTFQINPEIQRTVSKNIQMTSAEYASALPEDSTRMRVLCGVRVWELLQQSELVPLVRPGYGNMRQATMGDVQDVRLRILGPVL
eukprot:SAG22_NODE_906_length_6562_cov_11.249884_2_plen_350_part_00